MMIYLGTSGSETALSPIGQKLSVGETEIGRTGRTMSGKMVKDITATKKQFTIDYGATTGQVLSTCETILAIGGELNLIVTDDIHATQNYKVLMEPINSTVLSNRGRLTYLGLHSFNIVLNEV